MHALPNFENAPVVNLLSQNVTLRGFSLLTAGRLPLKIQEEIVTNLVKNTLLQQLEKFWKDTYIHIAKNSLQQLLCWTKFKYKLLNFLRCMVYITQELVPDTSTPQTPVQLIKFLGMPSKSESCAVSVYKIKGPMFCKEITRKLRVQYL